MIDNAYLATLEGHSDIGYVVDAPHRDAPLVVSFGFVSWDAPPRFDFHGRIRKLERERGLAVNRILVRDPANLWYQHGVPGLGDDALQAAAALHRLVASLEPTSVTTVGQSMGGYGAILFGALLGADRVLAFGPLSYLQSARARRDGDLRWIAAMEKLERFPARTGFNDLCALLDGTAQRPRIEIVFGSRTDADQATNLDALHARRLVACPQVRITELPEAPHAVVQWLRDARRLDDLLHGKLLPKGEVNKHWRDPQLLRETASQEMPPSPPVTREWREWIAENLLRGCAGDNLLPAMLSNGFALGTAQREIDEATRSPSLAAARRVIGNGAFNRSPAPSAA
jgi:pimeloyl-ACP methyl ester carboxylesterase